MALADATLSFMVVPLKKMKTISTFNLCEMKDLVFWSVMRTKMKNSVEANPLLSSKASAIEEYSTNTCTENGNKTDIKALELGCQYTVTSEMRALVLHRCHKIYVTKPYKFAEFLNL